MSWHNVRIWLMVSLVAGLAFLVSRRLSDGLR
jgi:hypothetical protein